MLGRFAVIRPIATSDVVQPLIQASYEQPILKSSYVLMSIGSVEADNSGRYKLVAELAVLSDEIAMDFGKVASDQVATSDATSIGQTKGFAEMVATLENVALGTSKPLTDAVATADAASKSYSTSKDESVTTADSTARAITKGLSDGVGINDLADVGDGFEFAFIASFSNTLATSDTRAVSLNSTKTDQVATSDAGSIWSQDYVSIDYTASDYVGISRNF
jgi:uncharacterized protein (UPF0254 family)